MEGWLKPALDELIQQHQHSLQSIEALKEEHRFWQLDGKGFLRHHRCQSTLVYFIFSGEMMLLPC